MVVLYAENNAEMPFTAKRNAWGDMRAPKCPPWGYSFESAGEFNTFHQAIASGCTKDNASSLKCPARKRAKLLRHAILCWNSMATKDMRL
ncbi:hypothetical protein CEXT_46111 [Caerostris extrusa]|uniref:Uncharacterized protein n=1 Tax=Caerostris extrusa TaxID=172846 RepID=A0AAV4VWC7_CAEEX|nr:hypothetical protein CEXT_46111 [Caerostris extrusa]